MDNIKKLIGPEGCGDEVSVGGQVVKADKDGTFAVPAEHAADLAAHGFKPAPEKKEAKKT